MRDRIGLERRGGKKEKNKTKLEGGRTILIGKLLHMVETGSGFIKEKKRKEKRGGES